MKILLIGGGGREHAMAFALANSDSMTKLYCAPGNPGILNHAEKAEINIKKFDEISDFCKGKEIDLVVVGPELPLAEGLADYLNERDIKIFGPQTFAAQLETSKGFAKQFMKKYNIPTAAFETFNFEEAEKTHQYINELKAPIVLKADGLAAGKGVVICQSHDEAHEVIDDMFGGSFGESGKKLVIEEFLEGEEASILAITDGEDYITLAPSQDHKRILDGDRGKNTGGMGAYAPAPVVNDEIKDKVCNQIIEPTIKGIAEEGQKFVGCLYAGLMIRDGQPNVIEYNVRLGDPEAQAVLPLFDGDFAALLYSAANGKLDKSTVKDVKISVACCVVLASYGYPFKYEKWYPITGIKEAEAQGAIIYHAGTALKNGQLFSSGGRVLGVTALGADIKEAIEKTYKAVDTVHFENKYFRRDIGAKALKHH